MMLSVPILLAVVHFCTCSVSFAQFPPRPCPEVNPTLRTPCRCTVDPGTSPVTATIAMDCDRVVFVGDFPTLPYGAPIVEFSQRFAGHQALPTQIFSTSGLALRRLDFGSNSIRRLTDRLFAAVQSTLSELILADNLLGDSLNPIFSTAEFHGLAHLRLLDISGNFIKAIEEGILKGCDNLQELYLDRNSLTAVPTASLNGPRALKMLSLTHNRINIVKSGAFLSQRSLERLDLSGNRLTGLDGGALNELGSLRELYLAENRLSRLNSDVFEGGRQLEKIDLSRNFITEFPTVALREIEALRVLNLSANMIQRLESIHLQPVTGLQVLDLSKNSIASLAPGTFRDLRHLKLLDVSLNSLRTIEDDAFEGLDGLETLILKDNNILLIPGSALGRLPRLKSLQLDYNRVAALSNDILGSLATGITTLKLSRNVIRELPAATFQMFKQLTYLDLTGNLLNILNADTFLGLQNSLETLLLGQNKISGIAMNPLSFTALKVLDLSENQISELPRNSFSHIKSLEYLNLSTNIHLQTIPATLLHNLPNLKTIDLSHTGLKTLSAELLTKSYEIENVYLSGNNIQEIPEGAFANLKNLSIVDLSDNFISNIKQSAFINVMNIQQLLLNGNQLNAFKGEFFNTGTSLEILNLSNNQLSYLFPSSFRIHPRLRMLIAARNKFNFFPAELIASLQYLEYVDLSRNGLKSIEELDFARLPRLRTLLLANNELDTISEMAFHNSTQLQVLDLSGNKLDRLGERTFEGLARLELLNLEGNILTELPETIFERARLQMLENINLSNNLFEVAPLKPLQRQYFFVSFVDLSHNNLKEIPSDDSIMVNIKRLDLSFNPLSKKSISNILGEPKTVRELNLAGTGIEQVTELETPFLQHLNLSYNNITNISEKVFERTTLLESLDLSNNKISYLTGSLSKIWPLLKSIQSLNVSNNPIQSISHGDLDNLESLRALSIHDLDKCIKIEKNAFKNLTNLAILEAYNYPRLGYLDVQGILQSLPALEVLDIELKDAAVGSDQLQPALHPRLKQLGVSGPRLRSISSGALAGLKNPEMTVLLRNTSVTSLPPALFFPVPRSSKLTFDVTGSSLTALTPQLLVSLDDRRGDLVVVGLNSNPIQCDCGARALRRWLPSSKMTDLRCSSPEYLKNKLLVEVGDDELTCDPKRTTTPLPTSPHSRVTRKPIKITTEPDIIWSIPPTSHEKSKPKIPSMKPAVAGQTTLNNDDTLIIGIVGGVVAFIAILIIIICIVRLRMTSTQYRGGPMANGGHIATIPTVMGPGSTCVSCKGPTPPAIYGVPPPYAQSYATLPHKMNGSGPPSLRPQYATMSRMGVPYYAGTPQPQPYFVSFPQNPDEKIYR